MALNLSTLTDSSTSAGILTDLAKSASNLDLVASLENRVSGGPNATQTTASKQAVAKIPTDGNQPYLLMDLVDDEYEFTTDSAVNGTIVVATLEGTYSANISLDASTQYDLQARGLAAAPNNGFLKNVIGYLITPSQLSDSEITNIEAYFVDKGAASRSAFGSVTSFSRAWKGCNSLTSFPLLDTSSVTNFINTWNGCNSLTSFPAIDTSSGTNFPNAWYNCSSLTSFPLINTSSGTNFSQTWRNCSSLTSFPALNTSSGTNFAYAWSYCNSLTSFPSGFFDSWSPASLTDGVFNLTWDGCTSLTAQSVENILTSLDTSGVYGTNTGASGGTQLSDNTIDIDYDTATGSLSTATNSAIASLIGKDWEVSINGVLVVPNLLDLAPAASYSLRSLDADADPNVVNVRRSSDNATSDFTASEVSDGTLTSWVGAGNDGHVTTWYDQGGTNHATQSTASNQPKIVDSGSLVTEGGEAALDFDGLTFVELDHSDLYGQNVLDSYYVTSTTDDSYIYPSRNAGTPYGMTAESGSTAGSASSNYGSPDFYANGSQITPRTRSSIHTATSGGQKLVAHLNATTTNWPNINFGRYSGTNTFNYDGKLQEMIFFNTDQSANRTFIENNINSHFTIYS